MVLVFDNGGAVYTPVSNGNMLVVSFVHGSTAPNSVTVRVDDFKVEGRENVVLNSLVETVDQTNDLSLPKYVDNLGLNAVN